MKYDFHRDTYDLVTNSIHNNSVTFLLAPRGTGKTVCLNQLLEELPKAEFFDFKANKGVWEHIPFLRKMDNAIKNNEEKVLLLDEIMYAPHSKSIICEISDSLLEYANDKTKIVITGSNKFALGTCSGKAFGEDAKKIFVDFLSYSEFLRLNDITEISTTTFNKFLYEAVAFHNNPSLKVYLKGCIKEAINLNKQSIVYLFGNDCHLIKGKIEVICDLCYLALFSLHNHISEERFNKTANLQDDIIGYFLKACDGADNKNLARKISNALRQSYSSVIRQKNDVIKQGLLFLNNYGLIKISPVAFDDEEIPDLTAELFHDETKVLFNRDILRTYSLTFNHPMFYVIILKEILKEDMPKSLPAPLLVSIAECYLRGLRHDSAEYKIIERILAKEKKD